MDRTNAERQRRYITRLKQRATQATVTNAAPDPRIGRSPGSRLLTSTIPDRARHSERRRQRPTGASSRASRPSFLALADLAHTDPILTL
jgi:hypothetical protein